MSNIISASPQVVLLGTDDKSGRIVTPERDPIPQHLPKFFLFTEKGTTKPSLVGGAKMLQSYGVRSFDKLQPYFNHATLFATNIVSQANTLMVQRVIPDDANPEANFTLYMDILADKVPNYLRNSDGAIATDADGNKLVDTVTPEIDGHKIKYIKEYNPSGLTLGNSTSKTGKMTDADGNTSTMFPILDLKAKYQGEFYNNVGIAIESIPQASIPSTIISEAKILPYKIRLVERESKKATAVVQKSLYGENSVMFALKPNAINPTTEAGFDLNAVFPEQWSNETDPLMPLKYSDYENIHVYYDNVKSIADNLMALEKEHVTTVPALWNDGNESDTLSWFDFTTDDKIILEEQEMFLIDIFSSKSSKNVKYFTLIHEDETEVPNTDTDREVQISAQTPLFLEGGSNGTMDNEMFETLVTREMAKYLDPDSEVMDMAINVESIIYDSGFTLTTKKELCNFIALRKDTMVMLSTHDASLGVMNLPLSDERSIAVNLKTRLQLTPESDYFGTKVMRGVIVGGTGLLSDGSRKERVPALLEIAVKSAMYMGAGSGEWKGIYKFDSAPGSIIKDIKDIEPSFIPAGVKPVLWNSGMVWSQPFDRRQYFFPAIQTVYEDDTSVLNSYFTVMAICTLNKIAAESWRNFTGTSSMSQAQLADAVVAFVNNRVANKFDNRFVIIPEVEFTEADNQRGYSYNLVSKIYAENMKTVCISRVEAWRMSDL